MGETEPERPAPEAEPEESSEEKEVIFGPETTEEDDAGAAG